MSDGYTKEELFTIYRLFGDGEDKLAMLADFMDTDKATALPLLVEFEARSGKSKPTGRKHYQGSKGIRRKSPQKPR